MSDEILIKPPITSELSYEPLGEILLAARNTKNLTLKDVSNNLRISIKQITSLETNDFSALPDAMITRGFIRNYARLLDIDAEPLLASYRARMPDKLLHAISVQSTTNQVMSGKESQPWLKYILSSILVLLFVLAWLFYVDYMPKPVKPIAVRAPEVATVNTPSVEVALPEIALPSAERESEVGGTANTDVNTDTTAATALPPQSATPNVTATTPASKTVGVASSNTTANTITTQANLAPPVAIENTLKANAARLVQQSNVQSSKLDIKSDVKAQDIAVAKNIATKKVTIAVVEQTWVRVSDKSGAIVFEKMLAADSVEGFDGTPPFNLLIGNAKAAKLTFLGKPVDLASSTKNNVAHLVLE